MDQGSILESPAQNKLVHNRNKNKREKPKERQDKHLHPLHTQFSRQENNSQHQN